jgi:ATP-dependent DNA helicase RecG
LNEFLTWLNTEITFLPKVGPKRAEVLQNELGVYTFGDLLFHFPFRYVDKTSFQTIKEAYTSLNAVQIKGKLIKVQEVGFGKAKRLNATIEDETGKIDLVWFKGAKWVKSSLLVGKEYIVFGKAKQFGMKFSITHPEMEPKSEFKKETGSLQPIYHSGDALSRSGLNSKGIEKLTNELLKLFPENVPETLPKNIIDQYKLMNYRDALLKIHHAKTIQEGEKAKTRLKFEELFFLQLEMLYRKVSITKDTSGYVFKEVGHHFTEFYTEHLPFELTNAQKRVVKEIRKDIGSGEHMNRLLQGDVGSGKTLVALLVMLIGNGNGFQSCIMAPTEILATQHFHSLNEFLEKMDIEVRLLTGSTKTAARRILHEELENGTVDILIGTHALLEDKVKFKNLGIAVIDEQHRFGVAQRSKLWAKNTKPPHMLVMTATPIPRTLAMTFYGDLDVSVIDELPPGRKPVVTQHRYESSRLQVFGFMENQIKKGRQVYVVYPLISESETLDYKNLMEGYESITRRFPLPEYKVSIVHGQMKAEDKEYEMQLFANGQTQIMVATTVIEVGVNVPNATVMIIESAERFGLSQLHQLRGRVGRGAEQSFCTLMTGSKLSQDGKKRMETMVETNDGFQISEVDLKLRGPGDMMGTRQSGLLNLKIANLMTDGKILSVARDRAKDMLIEDANLNLPDHLNTKMKLLHIIRSKPNWSEIS